MNIPRLPEIARVRIPLALVAWLDRLRKVNHPDHQITDLGVGLPREGAAARDPLCHGAGPVIARRSATRDAPPEHASPKPGSSR